MAQSDEEQRWVEALQQFSEQCWPGMEFDLNKQFPSTQEKKFWAQAFYDVAQGIFLRQIGNHEITSWQASAIGDACAIARMLMQSVHKVEMAWHPKTE